MKPNVTVRDPITGNVIFEGFFYHYSLNMSPSGTKFEVTGAIVPSKTRATSSVGYIDTDDASETKENECDHKWKTYNSGWNSYEYCDCGAKK